ncbi:MAG: hypothetical protein IPN60_08695 [Saprospiraceae bacterium]|nr:hypothetical protein [Candidatus Opimibacter skivensis]
MKNITIVENSIFTDIFLIEIEQLGNKFKPHFQTTLFELIQMTRIDNDDLTKIEEINKLTIL